MDGHNFITFLSDEHTDVGRIVKSLAKGYGFGWLSCDAKNPGRDGPVVAVGMEEENANVILRQLEIGPFSRGESPPFYALDVSHPIIDENGSEFPYLGESLTDWILCEHFLYGRGCITILGSDDLCAYEQRLVEQLFDKLMSTLIKSEEPPAGEPERTSALRIRSAATVYREEKVMRHLVSLRTSIANAGSSLSVSDADYLIGLFKNGFHPLAVSDDYDMRAWTIVVENELDDVFDFFVERELGFRRLSTNYSPLMMACSRGNAKYVAAFLGLGWSPNEWTDVSHDTPLVCAAAAGSEESFFALVEGGAKLEMVGYDHELTTDPQGEEFTVDAEDILNAAIEGGNVAICRYLVDKIGDVSSWAKDRVPDVLLDYRHRRFCLHSGIHPLSRRVDEIWSKYQVRRKEAFRTGVLKESAAMCELYRICAEGTEEELFSFYRKGETVNPDFPHVRKGPIAAYDDPSEWDWFVTYPIHEAAGRMGLEAIKLLIEKGADPKCTDYWNSEPLLYAVEGDNLEVAKYLVEECDNLPNEQNGDGIWPIDRAKSGSALRKWLGTLVLRANALTTSICRAVSVGWVYHLMRDESCASSRRYAYSLIILGEPKDFLTKVDEARRRLAEALLPTEGLVCAGCEMSVVGDEYSVTYSVEGCRRNATVAANFSGEGVKAVPLGRMGIYQCRRAMAKRRIDAEDVEKLMRDFDFVRHFPDPADRYVAIYKWLTGRIVFKSNATRVARLIACGEGEVVEFKTTSAGVHEDTFETICSFANCRGGDVFLGVNDRGQVVGLPRETLDEAKAVVKRMCSAKGAFSRAVRVGVQELILRRRRIVHIQVPRVAGGVAYKGCAFFRRGDSDYKM